MQHRPQPGILTFFFHHLYTDLAWGYDFVAAVVSLGRWKDWINAALPFIHGPRVLEVAFGTGRLQLSLRAREQGTILGLDASSQMARMARHRLRRAGLSSLGLMQGHAQSLPFPAEAFDTVVATFPNEFISQPQTLSEARRVLGSSGRLVIVPAAWIVGQRLPDRAAAGLFRIMHQSPVMAHQQVATRFKSSLEQAGFTTTFETVEMSSSIVLVMIASKYPLGSHGG